MKILPCSYKPLSYSLVFCALLFYQGNFPFTNRKRKKVREKEILLLSDGISLQITRYNWKSRSIHPYVFLFVGLSRLIANAIWISGAGVCIYTDHATHGERFREHLLFSSKYKKSKCETSGIYIKRKRGRKRKRKRENIHSLKKILQFGNCPSQWKSISAFVNRAGALRTEQWIEREKKSRKRLLIDKMTPGYFLERVSECV